MHHIKCIRTFECAPEKRLDSPRAHVYTDVRMMCSSSFETIVRHRLIYAHVIHIHRVHVNHAQSARNNQEGK